MKRLRAVPRDIDDYIARFPQEVQAVLQHLRATIRNAAPEAEEKISYMIPTFALHGNLVHFAAWQRHVGFYPGAGGVRAFKKELSAYTLAKGTVQLPLDQPLPLGLIRRIVQFRVRENRARATMKRTRK